METGPDSLESPQYENLAKAIVHPNPKSEVCIEFGISFAKLTSFINNWLMKYIALEAVEVKI